MRLYFENINPLVSMQRLKTTLKWTLLGLIVGWVVQGLSYFVFRCSGDSMAGYQCLWGGALSNFLVNIDVLYLVIIPVITPIFFVWFLIAAAVQARAKTARKTEI